MRLRIRPLTHADLEGCKAVIDSTGLFPSEMLDGMAAPYLSQAADDEVWFLAESDGALAGLVYCAPERMTDRTWNLLLIAVHQDRHGQGIGSELTRRLEADLASRGGRILLIETSALPTFDRTRTVYRRLGYTEVARIPEFYTTGEDKVVFWKALTG